MNSTPSSHNQSDTLRVTLVQNPIQWHNVRHNLDTISEMLRDASPEELIVLPENFATGFIVDNQLSDNASTIVAWMRELAATRQAAVTGTVAVHEPTGWYNRLFFISPDGAEFTYDKRHLFPTSPEPELFRKGERQTVIPLHGWNICPQICYDLRFPVWSRNAVTNGQFRYDILLYVANWPAARADIWSTLLQARAIENQCYVLGCNCVGTDPQKREYQGDTQAIAPNGTVQAAAQPGTPQLLQTTLSHTRLSAWRTRFPISEDWD